MNISYKHNKPYYEIQFSELKKDNINVLSFEGKEKISDLFEYQIRIISDDPALDSSKVLNKSATFIFNRGDEDPIKIHGMISHFEQYGKTNEYAFYKIILVPRLWRLTLIYQNEVYQDLGIDKLIEMVLEDAGLSGTDFKIDFKNKYPKNEYIVQYRETNLNFLNRRLEHFGIYYYFDHKNDKDIIVFTDANQKLPDIGSKDPISLNLNKDPLSETESILEISCREKVVTGMVQLKDYNYLFPEKQLLSESQLNSDDPGLYYDFGDNFNDEKQGDYLAKIRNQEFNCQRKIFYGTSDCRLFKAGYKFEMGNHYRKDWNEGYILTEINYKGNQNSLFAFLPQQKKYEPTFECKFEAIPFSIEFRPQRRTPIPKLSGIMSAKIESGSGNEYAFVDDHGRYKAKMLFDLSDKSNGEATMPIRLSQGYSGPGYGIHFPNHADTELLWACVDGNVDRPIGLGTIPNPSNASPVSSGNQTQSVIRTAANNEIVIDDSSGSEQIHINQECGNEIIMKAEGPEIEIKQKCGNQILMKEADGIQIRDKYGNEVVLDASSKILRIASPTHNSQIELGRSIVIKSESDEKSFIIGNVDVKVGGATQEHFTGIKQSTFVGAKLEQNLSLSQTNNVGFSGEVSYSKQLSKNYAARDVKSEDHIKFDSEKYIHLIGGKGDDSEVYVEENLIRIFSKDCGRIVITPERILLSASAEILIKAENDIILKSGSDIKLEPSGMVRIPRGKLDFKDITA